MHAQVERSPVAGAILTDCGSGPHGIVCCIHPALGPVGAERVRVARGVAREQQSAGTGHDVPLPPRHVLAGADSGPRSEAPVDAVVRCHPGISPQAVDASVAGTERHVAIRDEGCRVDDAAGPECPADRPVKLDGVEHAVRRPDVDGAVRPEHRCGEDAPARPDRPRVIACILRRHQRRGRIAPIAPHLRPRRDPFGPLPGRGLRSGPHRPTTSTLSPRRYGSSSRRTSLLDWRTVMVPHNARYERRAVLIESTSSATEPSFTKCSLIAIGSVITGALPSEGLRHHSDLTGRAGRQVVWTLSRETHAGLRPLLNDKAVDTESEYWATESSCSISPSVSAKSKTCALLSIRSFRADFGMTIKPR